MNKDHGGNAELPRSSRLEANTRRAFESSLARIDTGSRSRLAAARAAAVAAAAGEPRRTAQGRFGFAALAAAAAFAFAVVWLQQPAVAPDSGGLATFEDLDILLDEEELELFEELEFYVWLQEQPELNMGDEADGSG
jgi:hypothetical protein